MLSDPDSPQQIECIDLNDDSDEPRRIVLDRESNELVFINCLWPRRFFSSGYEGYVRCPLSDLLSVREYGVGELQRLHIAIKQGRCAISPDWQGYRNFCKSLLELAPSDHRGNLLDDPRILMPLVLICMFAIVGGVIWAQL